MHFHRSPSFPLPRGRSPSTSEVCACHGASSSRLSLNARVKRAAGIDPTRLGKERRAFEREILRRVRALKSAIIRTILMEDDYALAEPKPLGVKFNQATKTEWPLDPKIGDRVLGSDGFLYEYQKQALQDDGLVFKPVSNAQRYRFETDARKLEVFNEWLQTQIDAHLLTLKAGETVWTAKYIESAYRKGVVRAWIDTHKKELALKNPLFTSGSQAQFLQSTFAAPESLQKIQFIGTRTFNQMKGFTEVMKTDLNRILADGIANGQNPRTVAREMTKQIDKLTRKRAVTIARTEMTAAHAEGQLDSLEAQGVLEIKVLAEWITAGDDRVCPQCAPLEGLIFKLDEARGMLPRHPNCRCAFAPVTDEKITKKDKARRKRQLDKSVKAETRKKTAKEARKASKWAGADVR